MVMGSGSIRLQFSASVRANDAPKNPKRVVESTDKNTEAVLNSKVTDVLYLMYLDLLMQLNDILNVNVNLWIKKPLKKIKGVGILPPPQL